MSRAFWPWWVGGAAALCLPLALILPACEDAGATPDSGPPVDAVSAPDAPDDAAVLPDGAPAVCVEGARRCAEGAPQLCLHDYWQGLRACDTQSACQDGYCLAERVACRKNWCWENPRPHGYPVLSVWGTGANEMWAAVSSGVLRWDGTRWLFGAYAPERGYLPGEGFYDVGASLLAFGENSAVLVRGTMPMLHWDGRRWSTIDGAPADVVSAAAGTSTSEIWAIAHDLHRPLSVHRWDGTAWSLALELGPDRYPSDVWVSPEGQAFVAASDGTVHRLHDMGWASDTVAAGSTLLAIDGTSASDVWAAGTQGGLYHFDGSGWNPTPVDAQVHLDDVLALTPADAWASGWDADAAVPVLFHWDGDSWAPTFTPDGTRITALWGRAAHDVFALGATSVMHWDGKEWARAVAQVRGSGPRAVLFGVRAVPRDQLWAWGAAYGDESPVLLRSTDGAWSAVDVPVRAGRIHAVWGASAQDVWIGGETFLLHWNGRRLEAAPAPARPVLALSGTSASDLWAVGAEGFLAHYDGASWTTLASGTTEAFTDVAALAPDDAWAVGPSVMHWNGAKWSEASAPEGDYRRVFALSSARVWVYGGASGVARLWNGKTWLTVAGVGDVLWGTSATNLWSLHLVAGSSLASPIFRGIVTQWDGRRWAYEDPSFMYLLDLSGTASGDLWAVGLDGSILHRRP